LSKASEIAKITCFICSEIGEIAFEGGDDDDDMEGGGDQDIIFKEGGWSDIER